MQEYTEVVHKSRHTSGTILYLSSFKVLKNIEFNWALKAQCPGGGTGWVFQESARLGAVVGAFHVLHCCFATTYCCRLRLICALNLCGNSSGVWSKRSSGCCRSSRGPFHQHIHASTSSRERTEPCLPQLPLQLNATEFFLQPTSEHSECII